MTFAFTPAVREDVRLLISLAGSTGAGKTRSAMRLAAGLAGGEPFAYIDTENGRALHYADFFSFHHCNLDAPFTPARYAEAIKAADAAGYPVIVVDSASHEHAGAGGLLDMHEDVLARRAGDDWKRREALSMAAWVEPKREHGKFVDQLLHVKAHVILCFRAAERVEMATEKGRTVIRPKKSRTGLDGWVPIAEKTLPFEMSLSLLLLPDQPGVPLAIKLPEEHRLLLDMDKPLTEEYGEALATWAKGAAPDEDERTPELTAQLLDLADELDRRDPITEAIQKNRRRNRTDPAKHADWLEAQVANANAALDERLAAEDEPVEFES